MMKYQINHQNLANQQPFIMHDMPIHPGFEIEENLIESSNSIIYSQAENRLHIQKAILLTLLSQ